ncbi:arsenate reductase (azurin) small subunit [Schinkia azotoformans]|uniref:arsenate reductase (azurin) small subunit n=1 Tax=Schinkia azotoformans TaxID=1454 RepID=UPI002DBBC03D|nr:arsenate reductase (azurin) small subunit [Schinkia azotoformans]MEC1718922.1 arsenate reductase (azurin) small subunit [Schinkia azotoformans]MED4412866.1 arsenate reductase (azurin) small subunit [Schinkia azotoformans]
MKEEKSVEQNEKEKTKVISRRNAVKLFGGSIALSALYLAGCTAEETKKVEQKKTESDGYPVTKIANLPEIKVNEPITFDYPLKTQSNYLVDMGVEVPGGVGPNKSIVAYNRACQHMGCPSNYDNTRNTFFCPCHQTVYDPAYNGSVVIGQGKASLPRILLKVENNEVFAVGVDGLIYGYRNNLLDGERV